MADFVAQDEELDLGAVFTEPPRPPSPEPTSAIYYREASDSSDWKELHIRLIGSHPLWGHHLWNAAKSVATFLDKNTALYQDRSVLELGAGGGLPSVVAALNGASKVVVTDYPDTDLICNIQFNIDRNVPKTLADRIITQGYIWGRPVEPLLSRLDGPRGFDLIILSDLIFNHSQHEALLSTCKQAISRKPNMKPGPCILVFYTHHRPRLAHKDMVFFTKAEATGWTCEEILRQQFPPMFPDDPGDEGVRSTVHGWKLTLAT